MEEIQTPEELISPPEKRLIHTLITLKPHKMSFMVSAVVLLAIILFSQFYWMDPWGWSRLFPAINRQIYSHGEWWRLYSAILIHGDMGHLLSNLYMLGIFSFFVYGYFGLSMYPLWTFLGAGLVNALSIATYPPDVRLLGASGWVYLLGGFWLTLYLFIQRQYPWSRRLMRVFGMALMVFFPTSFEATTSYRTHFIGFLVGAVMAIFYFMKNHESIREKEVYKIVG